MTEPVAILNGAGRMPTRKPVGAEARGKWRQFRRELTARRAQIDSIASGDRLAQPITSYLRPGTVGRERIVRHMTKLFSGAARFEFRTPNYICWSYLLARPRVIISDRLDDQKGA